MLSPLIASVINLGGVSVTQELVARGANVNQAIPDLLQTPLQCVASGRTKPRLLWHAPRDPSSPPRPVLHCSHACHRNNAEAIKVLLAHGADMYALDYMERSVLHWAAIGCAAPVVRRLMRITQSYFLNAVDTNGYTPIMLAAEHGRADNVELLIELGADCTLKNKLNHNATELADWFGHKRAVELLFEATSGTRAGSGGTA